MVRGTKKDLPTAGAVPGGLQCASPARDSAGEAGCLPGYYADEVLSRKLPELWQRLSGLKLRHETGKILIKQLGPPTHLGEPQWGALRRVAPRLGVNEYELWATMVFAHHFRKLEDLIAKHRGAKKWSWTQLEELLVSLRASQAPAGYVPSRGAPRRPSKARVCRLTRSLKSVERDIAGLDGLELEESDEDWTQLYAAMRQMLRVAELRFDVRFLTKQRLDIEYAEV
jgi:hypothetical protein